MHYQKQRCSDGYVFIPLAFQTLHASFDIPLVLPPHAAAQWPNSLSHSLFLLMLRMSLASTLGPHSRNFAKCHGLSPIGKMQPVMLFRWLNGSGTRKFSPSACLGCNSSSQVLFPAQRRLPESSALRRNCHVHEFHRLDVQDKQEEEETHVRHVLEASLYLFLTAR